MNLQDYKVSLSKKALKQLEKIPKKERIPILESIDSLLVAPNNLDIKKLQGHSKLYRLRVSNYRIVFTSLDKEKTVLILIGAHRAHHPSLAKRL
jgi:mRNA interferase RelE/StbE